jgi:hypothetical protein
MSKFPDIPGLPLADARKIVQEMRESAADRVTLIADKLKVDRNRAATILTAMIGAGYVEAESPHAPSRLGNTLCGHKLIPRISRARADKLVAEMIARCEAINADPELACYVCEVLAFGSYITDAPELGDIDLVTRTNWRYCARPPMNDEQKAVEERRRELARAAGRNFQNHIDLLFWPEREVERMIKARVRSLSILPASEFTIEPRPPTRTIFKAGRVARHADIIEAADVS